MLRLPFPSSISASKLKWACGGWAFFIAENAILSENRSSIIQALGDEEKYHWLYGGFSTLATGSILYSYFKLAKQQQQKTASAAIGQRIGAWVFLSAGLILVSQSAPKAQIPLGYRDHKLQVRCPFDFSEQQHNNHPTSHIRGVDRITRHAGLWSLAFVGLGNAFLQRSPALRLWWCGPTMIAWLGGAHADSRFRRGMGGTLDPEYASQTSNVPFAAMITGKQGSLVRNLMALCDEIKPLNAALAILTATLFIVRRGR